MNEAGLSSGLLRCSEDRTMEGVLFFLSLRIFRQKIEPNLLANDLKYTLAEFWNAAKNINAFHMLWKGEEIRELTFPESLLYKDRRAQRIKAEAQKQAAYFSSPPLPFTNCVIGRCIY